jgi:hypothetical protein
MVGHCVLIVIKKLKRMGGLNIGIIERNRPTPTITRILVYLNGIVKGTERE